MAIFDHATFLREIEPSVRRAGAAIMDVHRAGAVADNKADGSPVTEADRRAEAILVAALAKHAPDIPVVSEENAQSHKMAPSSRYFLVDPLDGTREFLKPDGKGAFTVNIGLIENGSPALGVIYAPAHDRYFKGALGFGAFENDVSIRIRDIPATGAVALVSSSHLTEETTNWLAENGVEKRLPQGSSLKFGLMACGEADVYPRYGPTMEWDIAAGHAILSAAGGSLENPDGTRFQYGKPGYRNGAFIARAGR